MNVMEVARAAAPDFDDDLLDYLLWERTPFPMRISFRDIYYGIRRAVRASKHHLILCEYCNRIAEPNRSLCSHCRIDLTFDH
jgi:hypothetical protein